VKSVDIHKYARMNLLEELRKAISTGVDLNQKDRFGATALHDAISQKRIDVVLLLINHDADITSQDSDGKTSLHYAIEYNLPQVAEALLKKDRRVISISDKFGNQPLWTAVAKGRYEFVTLLMRYGADPEHRNNVNLAPVDIPKRKKDDSLLRILESRDNQ